MNVRRAGQADARAIAEVHVQTWQAAYRHVFPAEVLDDITVDERERLWTELLRGDDPVWVAEDAGRVVGFASAGPSRTREDEAELYAIYVAPEQWGSDAGSALMHAVVAWFIAEEYTVAMLWVVADNPRARRFYEREGWRLDGERTDVVRGTEIVEALYRLTLAGA